MIEFKYLAATAYVSNTTNEERMLSVSANKVLIFIWDRLNTEGKPFNITMEDMGGLCGIHHRSVIRAIRELTDHGVLLISEESRVKYWYYGVNRTRLIVDKIYGQDLEIPEITLPMEKVKGLSRKKGELNLEDGYYVYVCKVDGTPVYVGKGRGERHKHAISGRSHNVRLNEAFFTYGAERMTLDFIASGLDEESALNIEASTIKALMMAGVDLYNTVITVANCHV